MRLRSTLALWVVVACRTPAVWTVADPGGRTLEVRQVGGEQCVRRPARSAAAACFDAVGVHSIAFDRSGRRVAYAARRGAQWSIVRDGVPGRSWSGVGAPAWSADGTVLAYPAERAGRWHVVVNDSPGPAFDAILERSMVLGAGRVGYAAKRGDSIHVVVGDVVSRGWGAAAHLVFDPPGRIAAYAARERNGWRVVLGDSLTPAHDAIDAVALGGGGAVRTRLAYIARENGRARVVEADRRHSAYDEIQSLAWGGDHLVYLASEGDSSFIVRDGAIVERGARGELGDVAISASGRVAWVATVDVRMAVGDRARRDTFDLAVERTLQFVDGERVACLVGDRATRELFVVVDGRRVGAPLAWTELVRWVRRSDGEDALRAWVAAVAVSRFMP